MYIAPGQGHTTLCDKFLMSTESPYHFAHLLQVYKKKSDFKHIFNDFIYVYSPGAKADNPLGTHFRCQQKALITLPVCCRFKNNCFEVRFYIHFFFHVSPYIYSPGQGQTIHWGQNFDDNRNAFSLCLYVASFKIISPKSDFIHTFNDFIHVYCPRARTENPSGTNFLCQQKALITSTNCCKFQTNLFDF